jgi:hypothetical protein
LPALLRGGGLGAIAAAIGAGVYHAVAQMTGYEFGLMSIVLGLVVGVAVRIGSRGRGGWRYQALAMFLCYAAICATYVPRVIAAVRNQAADAAPKQAVQASTQTGLAAEPPPTAGGFVQALGMLFLFSLAIPFLAGAQNAMGLVIIAIGLYEAWKVNRGAPWSLSGPFLVGEGRGS